MELQSLEMRIRLSKSKRNGSYLIV